LNGCSSDAGAYSSDFMISRWAAMPVTEISPIRAQSPGPGARHWAMPNGVAAMQPTSARYSMPVSKLSSRLARRVNRVYSA